MNPLYENTPGTKLAGAVKDMLSRPAAAFAIAGSLSVLTLAASLYLFLFAGRELLPPPPIAGLTAPRIFEPIPIASVTAPAQTFEVAALPTAEELFSQAPAGGTSAAEVVTNPLTVALIRSLAPSATPAAAAATAARASQTPTVAEYNPEDDYSSAEDDEDSSEDGYSTGRHPDNHNDGSRRNTKEENRSDDHKSGNKNNSSRHYD